MNNIEGFEAMAKLKLSDEERSEIGGWADMLIESFSVLEQINTDDVEPLVSVLDLHSIMREDVVVKMLTRDELLSNAREQHNGYFQAPKTLD